MYHRGPKHSRAEDLSGQQEQRKCQRRRRDLPTVWQSTKRYIKKFCTLGLCICTLCTKSVSIRFVFIQSTDPFYPPKPRSLCMLMCFLLLCYSRWHRGAILLLWWLGGQRLLFSSRRSSTSCHRVQDSALPHHLHNRLGDRAHAAAPALRSGSQWTNGFPISAWWQRWAAITFFLWCLFLEPSSHLDSGDIC